MRIGVLALQGAFIEHIKLLKKLNVDCVEIRQASELKNLSGIILPGGESTVMAKLMMEFNLYDPLKDAIQDGLPTFGTCAGLVLLSKSVENSSVKTLGVMDVISRRNAYGRQLGSFSINSKFKGIGDIEMIYIRAPYIVSHGDNVEALSVVNGKITAARQGKILATAFHPELTNDTSVHEYFLSMI